MTVIGMRESYGQGSGGPVRYASREKNYENLPAPMRCRQRKAAQGSYLPAFSFIVQTISRPAVIGGGAMFVGTRVLEHCQKIPKGRIS